MGGRGPHVWPKPKATQERVALYEPHRSANLLPGDPRQLGEWKLHGRLGAGGMGVVFLGMRGTQLAAIKVIHRELISDSYRRRFNREVALASKVKSPFVAAVLEADLSHADGGFIATEYIAGPHLAAYIQDEGPLGADSLRGLLAAMAEGLASIHAFDIVHRDLTPRNVILSENGPKIVDFGLARKETHTTLTSTNATVGTPGWHPPEVLRGQEHTYAGDIFCLGMLVCYAATQTSPYGVGPTEALHYRIVHESPEVPALEPPLREIVTRCLARAPEARPSAADILRQVTDDGIAAEGPSLETVERTVRDNWQIRTSIAAVAPQELGNHDRADDRNRRGKVALIGGVLLAIVISGLLFGTLEAVESDTAASSEVASRETPGEAEEPQRTPGGVSPSGDENNGLPLPVRLQQLRYDPESVACDGAPASELGGTWQTRAQIYPNTTDESVEQSLSDKWATWEESNYDVTVTVINPEGAAAHATVPLVGDGSNAVWYPSDFPDAPEPVPGTYTTVFRVDRRFVACSGFVMQSPDSQVPPPIYGAGEALGTATTMAPATTDGPMYAVSADQPCETGDVDDEWRLAECAHLAHPPDDGPPSIATLWTDDMGTWRAVVYRNRGHSPVWDSGPQTVSQEIAGPIRMTTVSTAERESVVYAFDSVGTGLFTYHDVIDASAAGPKLVGGIAFPAPEWRRHEKGLLLVGLSGRVVADMRPVEPSEWRIWWRQDQ